MSTIDKNGMLIDKMVTAMRFPNIEHGALNSIHGIVVHQTDASTAQHSF